MGGKRLLKKSSAQGEEDKSKFYTPTPPDKIMTAAQYVPLHDCPVHRID